MRYKDSSIWTFLFHGMPQPLTMPDKWAIAVPLRTRGTSDGISSTAAETQPGLWEVTYNWLWLHLIFSLGWKTFLDKEGNLSIK